MTLMVFASNHLLHVKIEGK